MNDEETTQLVNARLWLRRSRQDFAAFRRFVRFTRGNYRRVVPSDPALAVYLLQQTHEKAGKAMALASGRYTAKEIRWDYGHETLKLLLDVMANMAEQIGGLGLSPLMGLFGGQEAGASEKLHGVAESSKAWRPEFASLPPSSVETYLDLLVKIRKEAILGSLRQVWGPHSAVVFQSGQHLSMKEPSDFVELVDEFWTQSLGQSAMLEEWKRPLNLFLDEMKARSLISVSELPAVRVVVHKSSETMLRAWAVVALVFLASLTWPHEGMARYPREEPLSVDHKGEMGCQDYGKSIGLVAHLGYAGYLTGMSLSHLDGHLTDLHDFFTTGKLGQDL